MTEVTENAHMLFIHSFSSGIVVKNLLQGMQQTGVWPLGWEDTME